MVDENVFREELRNLKGLIRNDPVMAARYDLDGNGEISGEEWDLRPGDDRKSAQGKIFQLSVEAVLTL